MLRGGIPTPTGNFPEILCQGILVGMILAGRLGVSDSSVGEGSALRCRRSGVRIPDLGGLRVDGFQVSGGRSTLQSRASGLQSAVRGIPSGLRRLLRIKNTNTVIGQTYPHRLPADSPACPASSAHAFRRFISS